MGHQKIFLGQAGLASTEVRSCGYHLFNLGDCQQFVDGGRRLRREERTYGLVERESRAWILEISWIRFILILISYVHI